MLPSTFVILGLFSSSFVHAIPLHHDMTPRYDARNVSPQKTLLVTAYQTLTLTTTVTSPSTHSAPAPTSTAATAPTDRPSETVFFLPSDALSTSSEQSAPLMMAYYPDWAASAFPPEKIDFSRFDWIDFAFALPQADGTLGWDDPEQGPDMLKRLVSAAHKHGKHVKLSVGGWTGSR